jgi:hypothetical protein
MKQILGPVILKMQSEWGNEKKGKNGPAVVVSPMVSASIRMRDPLVRARATECVPCT